MSQAYDQKQIIWVPNHCSWFPASMCIVTVIMALWNCFIETVVNCFSRINCYCSCLCCVVNMHVVFVLIGCAVKTHSANSLTFCAVTGRLLQVIMPYQALSLFIVIK